MDGWFGWCVLLAYKMGPVNVNGWLGWVVFLAYVMNCECEWMVWLGVFSKMGVQGGLDMS